MVTLQLDSDQASIVCDALTEWSLCQEEAAGKATSPKKQRYLREARRADAIHAVLLVKMELA